MADATILTGDIGINYLANNRQKLMYWIGGTETEYTMNELYSAMATLLDETTTIDSGTAFSAETPVEYTTGKIDTGDSEPWYMSFDLMEKITGGALKTSGWTRVQDSNTGIICVQVDSGGAIVAADRGFNIVHSGGDTGTLLEFVDTGGAVDLCFIRPDSDAAENNFDDATAATVICNAHQADVLELDGAATTGEMVWANLYSIGTIDPNVHLYLYQGEAADDADRNRVYSWNDNTQDWYSNGHIDICVALNDPTDITWSTIDAGYITVFARKFGDLYASFEVSNSTTSGGRNPIPLQTSADLDNTTGIRTVTTSPFSATPLLFTVGEIISEGVSGARGIVTGQLLDEWISYIPIDDPQIEFFSSGGQTITGATSGYTCTSEADADSGPATAAWFTNNTTPTIAFSYDTFDVDDDGTDEDYAITVNCQANPLTEVYEWMKYATRNGETTNDLDGINGERYLGGEVYIAFSAETTPIGEGENVVQQGSGATGIVVAYDTAEKVMFLRDTRGTFVVGAGGSATITSGDSAGEVEVDSGAGVEVSTFAPKTASPLGTFAGGTFFGARGVLLFNWITADENSFQLTPIEGGTFERPQAFIIEVTNLDSGAETVATNDRVSVFRLDGAGGIIEKTEYSSDGGEAIGDDTLVVSTGITQDTPGKTTGGWLVLVDDPGGLGAEYNIRYDSWDTSTFTLSNYSQFIADVTTNATQITDSTGSMANDLVRGDLVYNHTQSAVGYIKTVDSETQVTLEGAGIAGQSDGDLIEFNCIPVDTTGVGVYVPFINKIAASAEESVSVIFVAQLYFRVKVRNTRAATPIKPYSSDGTVATSTSNQSIPVIRTEDTIIS